MKHTRKQILSILSAAALAFGSLPQNIPLNPQCPAITASAAETSGTCGENLTWTYSKATKTLTISGAGNMDDYNQCIWIASSNKHRPWDDVDGDITKVVIEDGVNGIGSYAFYSQSVTEISIPDSVTTLSNSAFCGCDELTEITLPGGISEISDYAFEDCKILNKVTIKEGTAAIGDYAFCNCEKLTDIVIPDSAASIGRKAFSNCTALAEIHIPESVRHIGSGAFYNTAWLANTPSDEPLVIINGILYCCKEPDDNVVQNIVVPDGVTFINNGSFSGLGLIGSVTLPASVTEIDENAFYNCYGLQKVTISEGTTQIGKSAFYECGQLKEVTIPKSVTSIGEDAVTADDSLKIYGYKDSCAETYASENGIWFIALDSDDPFADYNYEVCEDGEGIRILSYAGKEYDLTVPAVINGLPVTEIGEEAFSQTGIYFNSIVLPESIKRIGAGAFKINPLLTEIDIPESVTEFGRNAFYNTKWLEDKQAENPCVTVNGILIDGTACEGAVTMPQGVKVIGSSAFMYNKKLTAVTVPDSVTAISDEAFYSCDSLAKVTFGKGLKTIGSDAFSGCSSLTDIVLPEGLTEIGDEAFSACSGLQSVLIPNSVTVFGSRIFTAPFMGVLKNVKISGYAGSAAEKYAEDNNIPFETITEESPDVIGSGTCGESLTWTLDSEGTLTISGSGKMDDYASYYYTPWHEYTQDIRKIVIAKGAESIGAFAFETCSNLTDISISDSVTEIGGSAFHKCTGITEIKLPDSIQGIIGGNAFAECSSLKRIVIPDGVTTIGLKCFKNCTSLETVTIPDSVTDITADAFSGCTALTEAVIPSDVWYITAAVFAGCSNLQRVTIPDSVTVIGERAFQGCKSLTEIALPESVTEIDSRAFEDCTGLTGIVLPDGLEAIASSTFSGCSSLASIQIPDSVTSIDGSAFQGCKTLAEITIPDGVTVINNYTFQRCSSLKSIVIPEGAKGIGIKAFAECTELTGITLPNSIESIDDTAFEDCPNLTVKGYAGSYAESYAKAHDIPFEMAAPPEPVSGDYNGDGEVSVADAVLLARFIGEDTALSDAETDQLLNANPDQDADGLVTLTDVRAILRNCLSAEKEA